MTTINQTLVSALMLGAFACSRQPPSMVGRTFENQDAALPAYAVVAATEDGLRVFRAPNLGRAFGCAQNANPVAPGTRVFVATHGIAHCRKRGGDVEEFVIPDGMPFVPYDAAQAGAPQ